MPGESYHQYDWHKVFLLTYYILYFHDDAAAKPATKSTMEWFRLQHTHMLECPSQSPNINPTENFRLDALHSVLRYFAKGNWQNFQSSNVRKCITPKDLELYTGFVLHSIDSKMYTILFRFFFVKKCISSTLYLYSLSFSLHFTTTPYFVLVYHIKTQ